MRMRRASQAIWLLRRLFVMSPAELWHRASRFLAGQGRILVQIFSRDHHPTSAELDSNFYAYFLSEGPQLFLPPTNRNPVSKDRLLTGKIPVFGYSVQWTPDAGFWHTDPVTGNNWPTLPTSRIRYRPGNPVGDVRIIWELNRLQHFFTLARIAQLDPGARSQSIAMVTDQLRSWRAANPPGVGVNGLSPLELALRIVSLLHTHDAIRQWVSTGFSQDVLAVVVEHAYRIERNLSLFSSSGNHTIGEAVGLLYAGSVLREHSQADNWRRTARELLSTESAVQIRHDGGNQEQSTWYLLATLDLMGLAKRLLAFRSEDPIHTLDEALLRGQQFLATLGTSPRDLPRIGDADDGA